MITISDKTRVQLSAALVATGMILYIPSNVMPVMRMSIVGKVENLTVLGGVHELYDSGLPWQYTVMPMTIAEIFGPLIALGSLSLLCITLYKFMLPDLHGTWDKILGPRERERFITRLEQAQAQGNPITRRQRKRLQRYIDRHNRDRKVWDRVERLQSHYLTAGLASRKQT